jgi:hypothetical protein
MIWAAALNDLGAGCSVDTKLDIAYVERRVREEGDTFFTVTLPRFGKDFEACLEDLMISRDKFEGSGRRERRLSCEGYRSYATPAGLPKFLSGFMELVFTDDYVVTADELFELRIAIQGNHLTWPPEQEGTRKNIWVPSDRELAASLPPLFRSDLSEQEMYSKAADAVAAIRQLCLMFGKEKSVCSESLVDAAVQEYVRTDEELMRPFSTEE